MGPISVSVREVTPTTSPGNPGPGLLTTATVAAPTPPAEPTTTTTTPSPSSGHHSHFQGNDLPSISKKKKQNLLFPRRAYRVDSLQPFFHPTGLHLLGATGSIFGSIFAPLLPQSSWLYNPLYHTQQYVLEPEWHALALRMAQQRLQRPDQARVEEMRKVRGGSSSPESALKEARRRDDEDQDEAVRGRSDSPDGSIEVDDRNEQDPSRDRARSDESAAGQDSPRISPVRSEDTEDTTTDATFQDGTVHLRPSVENSNDREESGVGNDEIPRRDLKIHRLEETVDLSTRNKGQDKENVGQDLTTKRKEEDTSVEREIRGRRERSPKPRQVWRPY